MLHICAILQGVSSEQREQSKLFLATKAAELYYLQDRNMEDIGAELNLSRSSVSRLLQVAKDKGIVEFRINGPNDQIRKLESQIRSRFAIRANVISTAGNLTSAERLERVGAETAKRLGNFLRPGISIGLAWGSTISAVGRHLYQTPLKNSTIVQLNGAGNDHSTGVTYSSEILNQFGKNLGASVVHFPVPAFFDDPEAKNAMWRERSTKRILDIQSRLDVAIFGLGRIDAEVPSQVYAAGYLSSEDLEKLNSQGIAGDVATVFFREDGTWNDIELNKRASGPDLDEFRKTPARICVVSGVSKLKALTGALNGKYITDLFIDDKTAEKLLEQST